MAPFCSAATRMLWMEDGAKGETEAVQPFTGELCLRSCIRHQLAVMFAHDLFQSVGRMGMQLVPATQNPLCAHGALGRRQGFAVILICPGQ